jgi:hypothetical protein
VEKDILIVSEVSILLQKSIIAQISINHNHKETIITILNILSDVLIQKEETHYSLKSVIQTYFLLDHSRWLAMILRARIRLETVITAITSIAVKL